MVKVKEKETKEKKEKVDKDNIIKKFLKFFVGVKKEVLMVRWPDRKSMIKYSVATVLFVVCFASFFYLIDILFALVRTLV